MKIKSRNAARKKRHLRVRRRLEGTAQRPRLNVFRSSSHIYAQVIDDESGHTLLAASSLDPEIRESLASGGNADAARQVGELLARRALDQGIGQVVFDRSGYKYHGRVAALADAAREKGLDF